jgi:hypothetical protein
LLDLRLLDLNARYMAGQEYRQLVENLKKDGALTSTPTVAAAGETPLTDGAGPETLEVLSGNHRVQAAIEAGIQEADVLEILTPMTRERKVAIQLGHNRIVGQDDPNVLLRLYAPLPLDLKRYSGHVDDDFGLKDIDLSGLSVGAPDYQEMVIAFLPEDAQAFKDLLERIETSRRGAFLAAHYSDFAAFFDAVVAVKNRTGVHNTAVAIRAMAELALERLDETDDGQAA